MTTKTSSSLEAQPNAQKQLNLLTLQEAAIYARVSISTVRRWVRAGELPVYHAGRQKRVNETDLVEFLAGTELRLV